MSHTTRSWTQAEYTMKPPAQPDPPKRLYAILWTDEKRGGAGIYWARGNHDDGGARPCPWTSEQEALDEIKRMHLDVEQKCQVISWLLEPIPSGGDQPAPDSADAAKDLP